MRLPPLSEAAVFFVFFSAIFSLYETGAGLSIASMRRLNSAQWRILLPLFLLLALLGMAPVAMLNFLQQQTNMELSQFRVLQLSLILLTGGVLFLTGGLGVWIFRLTLREEGRKRIGRFVEAMHYMADGLLVLDRRGVLVSHSEPTGFMTF